jgi:hypothetical protein
MNTPNLDIESREMFDIIVRIVERAMVIRPELDKFKAVMDITAAHNSCGLRLVDLENADDFEFSHDVFGIFNNINRETGQIDNCFLPRFAR